MAAASPEHLLAMKVLAARPRDADDIRFLVDRLGLADTGQVMAVCAEVFPGELIPERAERLVQELFETDSNGTSDARDQTG